MGSLPELSTYFVINDQWKKKRRRSRHKMWKTANCWKTIHQNVPDKIMVILKSDGEGNRYSTQGISVVVAKRTMHPFVSLLCHVWTWPMPVNRDCSLSRTPQLKIIIVSYYLQRKGSSSFRNYFPRLSTDEIRCSLLETGLVENFKCNERAEWYGKFCSFFFFVSIVVCKARNHTLDQHSTGTWIHL